MQVQIPKGTFDVLPYGAPEPWRLSFIWQYVEALARKLAEEYGYREIRTPIYERTDLFDRGVGETSDIVTKEMFTFLDKAERSMTLRPEGTSSVMRALIENRLHSARAVHKFYYIGPMFRYERPQSGRYRQHHQFGVEAIGVASALQDAEAIDLLCELYRRLGLKNLIVHLNSVGDSASRVNFRNALTAYLKPHFGDLSAESQARFEKNPLRILDSKDSKDREILKGAPSILSHLTPEAERHFQQVCHILDEIQIPYRIDERIVRGLDYYSKTVFEVLTQDLGAQNTIGAGGRYDGLVATFGGPDLPGVGFATGLERVIQAMLNQGAPAPKPKGPLVYFIPLGEEALARCFALATACRKKGLFADVEMSAKKPSAALQNATELEARFAALIGSDELAQNTVQLKQLATREQRSVPMEALIDILSKEIAHE